ncbi:hypothetical protein EC991_006931 [Linnemannia zychae]|nr:hypothetical protein EC991_006931 [Linnemannia zychae]
MEPYQQFRLGSTVELLAVRRDPKREYYYNRLSDIQHYFPSAWGFKVNGINILFLEDENEEWYIGISGFIFKPKRIAHYPDTIIDIVTANNTQDEEQHLQQLQLQLPSTPASLIDDYITTPQDIITPDLDKHNNDEQLLSPSSSKEDVDQSVPALSVQPNSAITTRPRRATFGASSPPAPAPAALHTNTKTTADLSGSKPRTMVHLVKHDGYEISRTAEFIEKYGSYVLGMLTVLKHSLELSSLTCPGLGVFHERRDPSSTATEKMVNNTINTINMTIDSLEKSLGLSNDSDAIVTSDKTDMDAVGAGETFKYLRALDGAEHRRLDTFLSSLSHDGFLGDLYRITTEAGMIKWVCFEHYRALHSANSMSSFIESVETNGGAYSPYLGKAVINLSSSSAAKDFFGKLASQALALDELDIALDWKFGSSDLATLASAVAQSNLRILRLDMRDDKGKKSAFEGMSLGKGRYHPLLQMVSSKKLRGVFFSNVHHLGSRVSGLPQNQVTCTLERFHLLNVIEPADQVRLANILTSCPNLVDLRIGSFSSQRKMHPTLYLAIASLKMIKNLHIYSMDAGLPVTNLLGDSPKWEDVPLSTDALKGLVSTGCVMNRTKLEGLIQASSGILEVLVLEFTEKEREIVELAPAQYREYASSSQQQHRHSITALGRSARPFSKLTHLHLGTGITEASIELLASVVWNLSLVHFGADEHSKRLLKYVNFASLKSLSLTDLTEYDLHPIFEAFLDEKRPCQLERMDLKIVGTLQSTLADILHAIPLKRLELVAFERKSLLKILPVVNLTRLEVLSIQSWTGTVPGPTTTTTAATTTATSSMKTLGETIAWDCEAALAGRINEVTDQFLVQCECGVHGTATQQGPTLTPRTAEGSSLQLPAHRIAFLRKPDLEHQHWQSILSTVF